MDLKNILYEIKRTLYNDKIVINENLSIEEQKIEILRLLNRYVVKNYSDWNLREKKSNLDEYVLKNCSQIKSEFNKYLLGLSESEKTTIQDKALIDPKLAKFVNDRGIKITTMNIKRNIKLSGFSIRKSRKSYILAYREKELSFQDKRYIIASELINIVINEIIPRQHQFRDKRVISFTTLNDSSSKYSNLIKSIVIDYYITEQSIKSLLENGGMWKQNNDIVSSLCNIYKMPRDLVEKRIECSRLGGKIKQLEGR